MINLGPMKQSPCCEVEAPSSHPESEGGRRREEIEVYSKGGVVLYFHTQIRIETEH